MRRALAVAVAAGLLGACSFGRLKPGLTKEGAAVAVSAAGEAEARRSALRDSLELFLAPGSTASARIAEDFGGRAAEFTGRARFKKGKGVVELRFGKILQALDKEGLLRPEGFASREPRVLLLVAESDLILDLGIGPAADSLRRGLSARGVTAVDGRDSLNDFRANTRNPADLAKGASRLGAEWMVLAVASASAELDPASGLWRSRANFRGDQFLVKSTAPVQGIHSDASVLDTSSAAARGKALDQVGEEAASKVVETITRQRNSRSEGAVFVVGGSGLDSLKSLLAAVRGIEGVEGAHLGIWRGEEQSVVLRVFLTWLKVDDLAARLLRRYPSLTLLSVEPEAGRLTIELPGRDE